MKMRCKHSYILILIIAIFFSNLDALYAEDGFDIKKWNSLFKLIQDEIVTINALKPLNVSMKYRLIELNTEKIKLIRQKEDYDFLRLIYNTKDKNVYYKNSEKLRLIVEKQGLDLIKGYPNMPYKGAIYHTIALNIRDFAPVNDSNEKRIEEFLLLALANGNNNKKLIHSINVNLAEYYYNTKRYDKGSEVYRIVIQNTDDEWYSKHLFNYGWCLFKTQKFDEAIEIEKRAFEASKNKKYISIEDQILLTMSLFFVHIDRIDSGIDFFIKNVAEPWDYLEKMAKSTVTNGFYDKAVKILNNTIQLSESRKKVEETIRFLAYSLKMYRQFAKLNEYMQTALKINDIRIKYPKKANVKDFKDVFSDDIFKEITEEIQSFAGHLQITLNQKYKLHPENNYDNELNTILKYFDILISLNPTNSFNYSFLQGESSFALEKFEKAAGFYQKAFSQSIKYKAPMDVRKKIIINMLSSLEHEMDKEEKDKFIQYAYTAYLTFWPKDKEAPDIFVRTFGFFLTHKDLTKAEKYYEMYRSNFPDHITKQKEMLDTIINNYISNKNTSDLARWLKIFDKADIAKYGIDNGYIETTVNTLATLLFNELILKEKEGKTVDAINGFAKLYDNENYPIKIRAEASYQCSKLSLKLLKDVDAIKWFEISFPILLMKQKEDYLNEIIIIPQQLALLGNFEGARKISEMLLVPQMRELLKSKNLITSVALSIFELTLILENEGDDQKKIFAKFDQLNALEGVTPEGKTQILSSLFSHFALFLNREDMLLVIEELIKRKILINESINYLKQSYWSSLYEIGGLTNANNPKNKKLRETTQLNKTLALIDILKTDRGSDFESIFDYQDKIKALDEYSIITFEMEKFDEQKFNNDLGLMMKSLIDLEKLVTSGSSYKVSESAFYIQIKLAKLYKLVAENIGGLSPKVDDTYYVDTFKKTMQNLAQNFKTKANSYLTNSDKIFKERALLYIDPDVDSGDDNMRNIYYSLPNGYYGNTMDITYSSINQTTNK